VLVLSTRCYCYPLKKEEQMSTEQKPFSGSNLRKLREEKGWNVVELSMKTGVPISDINYIENENRELHKMEWWKIRRICAVLGMALVLVPDGLPEPPTRIPDEPGQ
jgi:transcriptional regulator with XRE-family HTH domain